MHRVLLRLIVLDLAPGVHDSARTFWADTVGGRVTDGSSPEFSWIGGGASAAHLLVQRLEDGSSRLHFDLETDDIDAEVTRLERFGAERVERFEHWQVMRDPAGMLFCVVPAHSDGFEEQARTVED
jgi:hypothetical protein